MWWQRVFWSLFRNFMSTLPCNIELNFEWIAIRICRLNNTIDIMQCDSVFVPIIRNDCSLRSKAHKPLLGNRWALAFYNVPAFVFFISFTVNHTFALESLLSPLKCGDFFRPCINSRDFRMPAANLEVVSMICVSLFLFFCSHSQTKCVYGYLFTPTYPHNPSTQSNNKFN